MKQWIIVLASLTLIILLNMWQASFLNKATSNLISKIESIEKSIEEGESKEKVKEEYIKLEKVWKAKEVGFGTFCEHDSVEEIEEYISKIYRYISMLDDENRQFALIECNTLKEKIERIVDTEKLKLTNVL